MATLQLGPNQVTRVHRDLFDSDLPAGIRCLAVLEGNMPGQIFTDHPDNPTWAAAREVVDGTLYFGGTISADLLQQLITDLRRSGTVLISFWPHDEDKYLKLMPPSPDYEGFAVDFTDRPIHKGLDAYLQQVPDGCEIRRVDRELFEQSVDRDFHIAAFGSAEQALEKGTGFFLMRGDEILCEAFAGPPTMGIVEMGVTTREPYQRRGYATLTCAHLIRTCEERGYRTYWNCAKQNLASAAVARKLGYQREKEYRLVAWFKTGQ